MLRSAEMIIIKLLVGLLVLEHLFAGCTSMISRPITELILSAIDNLCPYSRICKQFDTGSKSPSEVEWTSEHVPCCGECSCGADCGKTDKCCFSGDNYVTARQRENRTSKTEKKPEAYDSNSSCLFPGTTRNFPKMFRHYEMIDTCPFKNSTKEYNSSQDQYFERCGDVTVAWTSMFPVYSPSTKRLYKNSVCASCHEVTDGVVWDISMSCLFEKRQRHLTLDLSEVINIDPERHSESSACTLTFYFPGNWSDIEHARCIAEPLVSKCSGTSFVVPANINMTLAEVVEACESSFYSPIIPTRSNQESFANVFCSICNLDYNNALTMCPNPNAISRVGRQFSFLLKGIDIREKYVDVQKAVKEVRKACLYIPHSYPERQDCRRIHCQTGKIRDPAGECHYVSTFMFTKYEITIDLLPNEDIPTEFVKSGISSVTDGWLKGPFSRNWKLVMLFFESYTVQAMYFIRKFIISLRIQTPMSLDVLLKDIKRLMQKHWYAKLNGTKFELRQEFSRIYDFSKFSKIGKEIYCTNSSFSKDKESLCALTLLFMPVKSIVHQSLIITKMVFCEQVELRESEYDVIVTKKVIYYKLRKLTLLEGEFVSVYHPLTGNYTVRMCLADAGFKILYDTTSASFPIRSIHICFITFYLIISIKLSC